MSIRHTEAPERAGHPSAGHHVQHHEHAAGRHTGHVRPTSRDPFFDNAKLLLVTLVVVGHSWNLLPDASTSSPVYTFLYAWHVPAFVLVTGYLSRSFTLHPAQPAQAGDHDRGALPASSRRCWRCSASPSGHEDLGMLYLSPHWPMWYLSALFLWRLATPLFKRVPHPLVLAVAVSLVGGLNTLDWLDLPRTLGLLPFFVAGMTMRREHFEWLAQPRVRVVAAGLLVTALRGRHVPQRGVRRSGSTGAPATPTSGCRSGSGCCAGPR